MIAPISRILLRYVAGALAATGLLAPDVAAQMGTDPDIVLVVAAALTIATEAVYALAVRKGWAK
jgi:hypothetical protein